MSVRARDLPGMHALIDRVKKVAEGAALMTETNVSLKVVSAVSNLLGNTPLEQAMQAQFERLGPPPFDVADRKYAAEIQATLSAEDIASAYARAGVPARADNPLVRFHPTPRHQGCRDDRLDRRRRRELGGADRAGAGAPRTRSVRRGIPGRSPRKESPDKPKRAWCKPPR